MTERRENIRNVAVIAHVDHGKTTLVDAMLRQSGLLNRQGDDADRVMDSFDLERERGITILAKNTSVNYGDVKINILDTPGHHDFGGEVERTLLMADGVLLLVDAAEGPLPQTRFVLTKALRLGLPVIVAINKIDRKDARADEVLDEVYDLFIDLDAADGQIEFPVLFTDGRAGVAHHKLDDGSTDLRPLFDAIVNTVPAPEDRSEAPLVMQVNNLGYDEYVGRLIIGRIYSGSLSSGSNVFLVGEDNVPKAGKVMRLYMARGLLRDEVTEAVSGDIVSIAGIDEVTIGDTVVADPETPARERVRVDEPTMAMSFCVNTGPFSGNDGKYVTSRNLRDRLFKEAHANVSIKVEETTSSDVFNVVGRGELQLGVLVETMRREGYELMLSRPRVVTKEIDGELHEPLERLYIDCAQESLGPISELLGPRKGALLDMNTSGGRATLVYRIPTRGLIGFHSTFLTETRGTGIMNTIFDGWTPWSGPIETRRTGTLVADRKGESTAYALFHLQPRGNLMIEPGWPVYEGMIIGETPTGRSIDVNPTKEKKLTNIRAAGKDENLILSRPKILSLEQAIEFINDDELVEVTPKAIRLRKRYLGKNDRHRCEKAAKQEAAV